VQVIYWGREGDIGKLSADPVQISMETGVVFSGFFVPTWVGLLLLYYRY